MTESSVIVGTLSGNKEIINVVTLTSSIVHELKNYLAGINMCAELAENSLQNVGKIRKRV